MAAMDCRRRVHPDRADRELVDKTSSRLPESPGRLRVGCVPRSGPWTEAAIPSVLHRCRCSTRTSSSFMSFLVIPGTPTQPRAGYRRFHSWVALPPAVGRPARRSDPTSRACAPSPSCSSCCTTRACRGSPAATSASTSSSSCRASSSRGSVRELHETGRLDLPAFYARRARRLLPAAALLLVVTVVASVIFLPPLRVGDVAATARPRPSTSPTSGSPSQATDYLQAELAPSPLLHFWSLGVEEQFYLFWPALSCSGRRPGGDTATVGMAIAVVAAGSLALSLVLTRPTRRSRSSSLPARAWELAIGGLALARPACAVPAPAATAAVVVGLALIDRRAGRRFDLRHRSPGPRPWCRSPARPW